MQHIRPVKPRQRIQQILAIFIQDSESLLVKVMNAHFPKGGAIYRGTCYVCGQASWLQNYGTRMNLVEPNLHLRLKKTPPDLIRRSSLEFVGCGTNIELNILKLAIRLL